MPNQTQFQNGNYHEFEKYSENHGAYTATLARLTEANNHLAKINKMKFKFEKTWSPKEVWAQGMACFEAHRGAVFDFVQSLPGYSKIPAADRIQLFSISLYPITVAQLSIDYDLQNHNENYLSMDDIGRDLMVHYFPCIAELRQTHHDAGEAIKKSSFDTVELNLLTSLLFFQSNTPNLTSVEKVQEVETEYLQIAAHYIRQKQGDGDQKAVQLRLGQLCDLVNLLASLHQRHQAVMASFAQQHSELLQIDQTHYEMFTKRFHS